MRRTHARLTAPDGSPLIWIGANYWSRTGGPLMWRGNYDGEVVDSELRTLRAHGLGMTRSFFYWPDFMPGPHDVDERLCARYADFLDRHQALGMSTVPTLIVGHMSGENWDPSWRGDRDLYSDVRLVARQAWFAREMARRFAGHPAVAGWLLSNEMPIYGRADPDRETVASWAQLLIDSLRAGGATQPVSLGDGAWGLENSGSDNGFSLRDGAELADFLGPHVYSMEDDAVRQHYAAAWICELTGTFGRPVVLEEFGLTSAFASAAGSARYYRQALHNSLLAGASGWVAWNNTDYDRLAGQRPYQHHAFEMYFGITDGQGRPKAPLRELHDFAGVLEQIDFARCERADSGTALVVSSYLDTRYPFTQDEDRTHVARTGRQAWIAARLADAPPALERESDGLRSGYRLYLVPSVKQLLAPTWHRLEELAREGSHVYVSYSPGTHDVQRGPWYAGLNELFGLRHELEYGLVDPIEDETVTLTLTRALGHLPAGTDLAFAVGGDAGGRVFLPVAPEGAEVLATDSHGRPALLERRVGRGSLLFCCYPLEHMAAVTPRVNPEATAVLYSALAEHAGVPRPVRVTDERVAVDRLVHADGTTFVWLVSQSADPLAVSPLLPPSGELRTLEGAAVETVELGAYGVRVLRLAGEGER